MDTTISKVNSTQSSNSIKQNQMSAQKDTVSEVGKFQETLKELETPAETNSKNSNNVSDSAIKNNNNETTSKTSEKDTDVKTSENITNETQNKQNNSVEQTDKDINKEIQNITVQISAAQKEDKILNKIINPLAKDEAQKAELKNKKENLQNALFEDKTDILDNQNENLNLIKSDITENLLNKINEKQVSSQTETLFGNINENSTETRLALQSLSELNSKISAINSLTETNLKSKTPLGSIKMSMEDANFFVNMVENQTSNSFQANITINGQTQQISFADAKAQVLQSSASVSQALIDKLQESMNTNKAFRVDFDNNVAVVMRVDSSGVLSANFIPGSSAVEQYLRNNIAELRQTFEDKGIEYNELSYSSSKKQNQNKQQRNRQGGQDE